MTFGERLKAERERARLNVPMLAELSSFTANQIYLLEKGQSIPNLLTVAVFARVLQVPVDYLVSGEKVPFGDRNESPCLRLGERIEEARKAKGLSIYKAAKLIRTNYHTLWNWERGNQYPRTDTISEAAKVLGVTLEYLVYGERRGT